MRCGCAVLGQCDAVEIGECEADRRGGKQAPEAKPAKPVKKVDLSDE